MSADSSPLGKRRREDDAEDNTTQPPTKRVACEAEGLNHADFCAIVDGVSKSSSHIADMLRNMELQQRNIEVVVLEIRRFQSPPRHAAPLEHICALLLETNAALKRDVGAACAQPTPWTRVERLVEAFLVVLRGTANALRELTFNVDRHQSNLHELVPAVLRLHKAVRLYRWHYLALRGSWCLQSQDEALPAHAGARQRHAQPLPTHAYTEVLELYDCLISHCTTVYEFLESRQREFADSILQRIVFLVGDCKLRLRDDGGNWEVLTETQVQLAVAVRALVSIARLERFNSESDPYPFHSIVAKLFATLQHLDGFAVMIDSLCVQ